MAMEYYRLQKIKEGSIDLITGEAGELNGMSEAGIKRAKEEKAPLSEIIDVLNDHIKSLKKEIDEKDEQIKTLHDLLNQSLKNQSQSNFVLAQQTQQAMMESENRFKKVPWYKRIFQK